MYEIIKETIDNTNYKLEEMLDKIYVLYAKDKLTKEEMEELETYAREKANTDSSIDVINKLKEIDLKMQDFDKRIIKLENAGAEEPEGEITYPAYVPGKWYYNGNTCSENGKNYICIVPEGQVCVWSPSKYPAYWQEVVEENTEETVESEVQE